MNKLMTDTLELPALERLEMGRAWREKVPRQAHAEYELSPNGRDPLAILEQSNQGRLPDLIPIRYGRTSADPFAFLRGSAALMAHDLSSTPASGVRMQAWGQCHLANFGLFATPERGLVFDLNDLDETLPAPWEWDIKRLASSFVVAGRNNGHSDASNETAMFSLARSYRKRLRASAKMRVLDVWYSRLDDKTLVEAAPNVEARKYRKRIAAKARASVAEYLFPKITGLKDGRRRIVDQPPLFFHVAGDAAMISGYLDKGDTFDRSLASFARAYADQTEKDSQSLLETVKSRIVQTIFDR